MLIFDFHTIGSKLYAVRKKVGISQAEVAEAAGISDRTYADIERGSINARIETILRICNALHITPDEIFTEENTSLNAKESELLDRLHSCSPHERETALQLLNVYLHSLNHE